MAKFGYVEFSSHSCDAISNKYENIDELRKELFGKTISEKSINDALKKVNIIKYGKHEKAGVYMFCPDDGIALIGREKQGGGYYPSIEMTWKVSNGLEEQLKIINGLLTEIVANFNKNND